ncbi:PseG/SpsG family protein [Catenuloplanes sp. NPDC051500]|uniref:PseG/SpsG family protein n=1 Tax=Catenuloplanes sp. NPDC051500 TaxID=3363959 RepID=UPI00379E498A
MGVGHLVRCLALAEELIGRGCQVALLGDVGSVPWTAREIARLGLPVIDAPASPEALAMTAWRLGLEAVVIDSYVTDPACAAALRAEGVTVLAIVDGDPRGQSADLYLDQNLGAERAAPPLPPGATRLAGLPYVLLRDSVRSRRPAAPRPLHPGGPPTVVCFFGGTDPTGAAPVLAGMLAATGIPLRATVVTASASTVTPAPGQTFSFVPNTPELPALLDGADLVLAAAGTSTWELLCLGVCPALIMVADNQRLGYDAMLAAGLGIGLGARADLPSPAAIETLRAALTSPNWRHSLAARGWSEVDGDGRVRAADALLAAVAARARG